MAIYRFDENAVRFRVVTKEGFEADRDALYVMGFEAQWNGKPA
jgi:hypothetical protein